MKQACNEVRNQIVQNLSGARSGKDYIVPGTSRHYTASAPGEYPATRLGDLKGSIKTDILGRGMSVLGVVGTPLEYGLFLEKKPGSEGGREWLRPSMTQAQPEIKKILSEKWF